MEDPTVTLEKPNPALKDQLPRHYIEIDGRKVEYADFSPERLTDSTPVLFAQGWGASINTYQKTLREFANQGRRIIMINYPKFVANFESQDRYPAVELTKSQLLLELLERIKVEKVDLVTHSEGSIYGALAIFFKSDSFRNVVFVNPTGLAKNTSIPRLAKSSATMLLEGIKRIKKDSSTFQAYFRSGIEHVKYLTNGPIAAIKEIQAIVEDDATETVKRVRKLGHKVAIIHTVDDPLFPVLEVSSSLPEKSVEGFLSVRGNHNEIYVKPKPMVKAISYILAKFTENSRHNT